MDPGLVTVLAALIPALVNLVTFWLTLKKAPEKVATKVVDKINGNLERIATEKLAAELLVKIKAEEAP